MEEAFKKLVIENEDGDEVALTYVSFAEVGADRLARYIDAG